MSESKDQAPTMPERKDGEPSIQYLTRLITFNLEQLPLKSTARPAQEALFALVTDMLLRQTEPDADREATINDIIGFCTMLRSQAG